MFALPGIGMFIEVAPIEISQTRFILREMPRHPIKDHAYARLMQRINQRAKIVGRAKTTGGRVHAGRLIAPGAIKRVFSDGQEFDMRVSQLAYICWQLFRQFTIREKAPAFFWYAPPGP